MTMQISVDPAALSQEQREAVAGFILAYPGKACAEIDPEIADIPAFIYKDTAEIDPEIAQLAKEGWEFDASVAFGDPVAAAVFADTTATTFPWTLSAPLPPVSDAQTAPAAPTTHAGGVDLDKHGLPWDGRIHASTKRKNVDDSWTTKRGVDLALVASVEAELRQVMGATGVPLVPLPPAVAPAPVAGEVPDDARAQFVGLVGRASAAIQGQKVTQAEVNQCCADAGVPALPLLANRLDLVAQVAARVDALIAARQ